MIGIVGPIMTGRWPRFTTGPVIIFGLRFAFFTHISGKKRIVS